MLSRHLLTTASEERLRRLYLLYNRFPSGVWLATNPRGLSSWKRRNTGVPMSYIHQWVIYTRYSLNKALVKLQEKQSSSHRKKTLATAQVTGQVTPTVNSSNEFRVLFVFSPRKPSIGRKWRWSENNNHYSENTIRPSVSTAHCFESAANRLRFQHRVCSFAGLFYRSKASPKNHLDMTIRVIPRYGLRLLD